MKIRLNTFAFSWYWILIFKYRLSGCMKSINEAALFMLSTLTTTHLVNS